MARIAVVGLPEADAGACEAELKALGHELVPLNPGGQGSSDIPPVVLVGGVSAERIGRAILLRQPETVIVLLISDTGDERVRRGLAWGAAAVIDIATPARTLAAIVTMLCDEEVAVLLRNASSLMTHASEARSITRAQRDCLRLLDSNLTVAEMAVHMHRSKRSMQRDLARLYQTLGVEGRKGALAVVHDLGILEDLRGREPRP